MHKKYKSYFFPCFCFVLVLVTNEFTAILLSALTFLLHDHLFFLISFFFFINLISIVLLKIHQKLFERKTGNKKNYFLFRKKLRRKRKV